MADFLLCLNQLLEVCALFATDEFTVNHEGREADEIHPYDPLHSFVVLRALRARAIGMAKARWLG
jgi:hypothetical protein